jgi:hypothetical protein
MPQGQLEPEEKAKVMEDAVDWLRKNDPPTSNVDDPTLESLTNLAGIALPKHALAPEEKKRIMEDAVNWLRKNDLKPEDVDQAGFGLVSLANLSGLPLPEPTYRYLISGRQEEDY